MDSIFSSISSALAFLGREPVVAIIVVLLLAGAAGWFLTLALERYFFPTVSDPEKLRHQKGATFLLCLVISAAFDVALWAALKPGSPLGARVIVSLVTATITTTLYPVLAALATKRWPQIGSAWSARQ